MSNNTRILQPLILLCSGLLLSVASVASEPFAKMVGSAYSIKTGSLVYRETHQPLENGFYQVEYSEPEGQVFGSKMLNFSMSAVTPNFLQVNERNGERTEVKAVQGKLEMIYQENSQSSPSKKSVSLKSGMVVDAGFDAFIKQYWDALVSGKTLDVDYLVPSELTTFAFRFSRVTCLDETPLNAQCFSLSPISWVVKLAVDPLIVAYDSTSKRLLRFTGRANICDAQGKYESVDIQYRYF
ncbi:hypothetical protein [Marinomonas sp. IMCC 4694]|uniref:hypothetical protein n=1 Tax=Marinomonas sp. IMCC 4694 TaxID=2605432 RepID=UPI0011E7A80D|nr:hypothetical protein [Marinomonas sp. IMCC 4694]TYL46707.1 hypothetical protein FXV75_01430 [Marinomonas sp. IMCC 4694]